MVAGFGKTDRIGLMNHFKALASLMILLSAFGCASKPVAQPLPNHPGNIFQQGEEVSVSVPAKATGTWRLKDYDGKQVAEVTPINGKVQLGKLPIGYYELYPSKGDRITVGVVAPLLAKAPDDSPISSDVAMAWFYPDEAKERDAASLCVLAGINWVRDRLSWPIMEPKPGEFAGPNVYDQSARVQTAAGLKVLQVSHIAPAWQSNDPTRFPNDLRDAYRFYREMAKRWRGEVLAFEPWNEAEGAGFGGHTGSEMASMQKASYLGLKAGNPDIIACLNVFAQDITPVLDDYGANEAWPYIETYNFHHYCGVERYASVYANHRRVSAGKPFWITECNIPVKWEGDPAKKEPSDEQLRVAVQRVARIFATSLNEGGKNVFYFILGDYVERQTQYGLVHQDLTPRPGYLALAAVGRLLAGAKPMGQWLPSDGDVRAYVFHAKPDGKDREVLVAWSRAEGKDLDFSLPMESSFDCIGRPVQQRQGRIHVEQGPVFVVMPIGSAKALNLKAPPTDPPMLDGKPSNIVFQVVFPRSRSVEKKSAFSINSAKPEAISVFAYNFGDKPARGKLSIEAPSDWKLDAPKEIELTPGDRRAIPLTVTTSGSDLQQIKLTGDFGNDGRAVVSFRLIPQH